MTKWEYVTVPLLVHATKQILDNWGQDGWELVRWCRDRRLKTWSPTSSARRLLLELARDPAVATVG